MRQAAEAAIFTQMRKIRWSEKSAKCLQIWLSDLASSHSPCQTLDRSFKRQNLHRWRPSSAPRICPPMAKIMSTTMCFTSRSLVIVVTSTLMQKLGQSWNVFLTHQPVAGPSSTCLLLVICQSCSGESHQTDDAPRLTFSKLHLDLVTKTHPDQILIHTVLLNMTKPQWRTQCPINPRMMPMGKCKASPCGKDVFKPPPPPHLGPWQGSARALLSRSLGPGLGGLWHRRDPQISGH